MGVVEAVSRFQSQADEILLGLVVRVGAVEQEPLPPRPYREVSAQRGNPSGGAPSGTSAECVVRIVEWRNATETLLPEPVDEV